MVIQRAALVVAVLAACKAAPAPAPIANRAQPESYPTHAGCWVHGTVRDAATHEPLAGATVVVSGHDKDETEAVISDEQGMFSVTLSAPQRTLEIFYLDATLSRPLTRCTQDLTFEINQASSNAPIIVW